MTSNRRDYRGVIRPVGAVVMGLGVAIGLCAWVGGSWDRLDPDPSKPTGGVFELSVSALVVIAFGVLLYRYGKEHSLVRVTRRDALLAVSLIWVAAGVCGGLPFMLAAHMSPTDAFFEAVSGLTTTGATVITDIETRLPRPLLLWRSLIQWLGGMGIVVLFVAVFPSLGAGGKHMFRGEVPGATAEGLKPRIAETSFALWKLYAALTALEVLLLSLLGMDVFDAICHAFTTMSTGGFSTLDSSVGGFHSPAIEYVIACFMLVGTVNYGLYYAALRGRNARVILRSAEFRAFVVAVVTAVTLLTLLNIDLHGDPLTSFRNSFFLVATTISSTGYGTHDYAAYSSPALTIMILLMFVGGCSGSTAGGIKVERAVLMGKQSIAQIKKSFRPAIVQLVRMGRSIVNSQVLADVTSFFVVYMGCMGVGVLLITLVEGVPFPTSFGAMLTCLSNMGPAPFHELAGMPDNFAGYSAVSKMVFCVAMLLGRLEFFTLFALLIPEFWRR